MDENELLEIIAKAKERGNTELDLSHWGLTSIPRELGQLTNLRKLYLRDNRLTMLPDTLGGLVNLRELSLSRNQLRSIPDVIGDLTSLRHLYLHHNQLASLPDPIGRLTKLRRLDLAYNELTALPNRFGQLIGLEALSLVNNQLKMVPPELTRLTKLLRLYLGSNRLGSIPPELAQLTNLRRLLLYDNQLTSVPPQLGQLTNLQVLNLSDNQLAWVPRELPQLTNLQVLVLSGNQLRSVPPELAELANLSELYLSGNQLTSVPPELAKLERLERLELGENPLVSPPSEVVSQGTKAILAYLRELRKGTRRRYEAKLLILGHGKEGKTCVSRALRGLPFQENTRTEGVEIVRWEFDNPKDPDDESKKITLNIWDFEGQEINHQSHQFFLTDNALYLLVMNGRQDFKMDRAEYWLDTMRSRAPSSRVILVASECENTTPSWPLDRLKAHYEDLLQGPRWYFPVGCHNRRGVDELAREIQTAAAEMEIMGKEWPQTFDEAEKRIRERAEQEPSVGRGDLCDLLQAGGISANNLDAAIDRLATLGVITQFKDSPELQDFLVLNPQWLTKGVSQVMEDRQLEEDKGEITLGRMRAIWDGRGYRGLFPTLHNCMKEFELCYDMEDKAGCLIPPRFGDVKPPIPWGSIPGAKVRRIEYKLNITPPKGIMSRFIVKTHHMIAKIRDMPKGVYWQHGVFLRTGEGEYTSEALCEFNPLERTLSLEVRAAFPQNMIEQLHGFAKAVFGFFEGLEPERKYGCVKFEAAEQQCPEAHAERRILFALSRNREIDCDKGWHVVDPTKLAFGYSTFGEAALTVEELRHELDKRPAWAERIIKDLSDCLIWIDKIHTDVLAVHAGQKTLPAEMKQQAEMGMREYLRMLNEMLDDRDFTSAPGVISLAPVDKSPFNPKNWFEKKYILTPYCESERGVHPVSFEVPFAKPRIWWDKTAPKLAVGLKVLSAGLSIAFAGVPLAIGDELHDAVKNDVNFMKELAKHIELEGGAESDISEMAGGFVRSVGGSARALDFRDLSGEDQKRVARQQLARLLEEIAPDNYRARQWGPLKRRPMPDNTYRWLCEEHAQEYK
jgi:Leucine-rich repeat (LRR) protein